MNVGSLFSGIGGIDLGLERAGMRVAWQCESDPYCRAVLRKHWPLVPCFDDVRTIHYGDAEPVDVLAGGFPCQPVSRTGYRLAQSDERWLWPEFARLVRLLRPRFVLVENVPGLFDRGMGDVLGDLAASGYDAEWDCIPAASAGAPHIRDRVWIVAHARSERRQRSGPDNAAERSPIVAAAELERQAASGVWASLPEPDIRGVANGVPNRVDRLRALGNAVVPQVVEAIGRRMMEAM